MHREPVPTFEEWAAACDLRRRGSEFVGPCPLCGGDDRFHVRRGDNGQALVGCRGCIDGQEAETRHRLFGAILRVVFPHRYSNQELDAPRQHQTRAPRPTEKRTRHDYEPERKKSTAATLWERAVKADGTLARRYLAERRAWPPDGTGPDLPSTVRWLPKDTDPGKMIGWENLPAVAAGGIVYRFATPKGDVTGVSVEALTSDGNRLDIVRPKRWRHSCGAKKGAYFTVRVQGPRMELVLCEGEVTALAAAWLRPGCECRASGGRDLLPAMAHFVDQQSVIIEADGDARGQERARELLYTLQRADKRVRTAWRSRGRDAADELADLIKLDMAFDDSDPATAWKTFFSQRS